MTKTFPVLIYLTQEHLAEAAKKQKGGKTSRFTGVIELYRSDRSLNKAAEALLKGANTEDLVVESSISIFLPDLFSE